MEELFGLTQLCKLWYSNYPLIVLPTPGMCKYWFDYNNFVAPLQSTTLVFYPQVVEEEDPLSMRGQGGGGVVGVWGVGVGGVWRGWGWGWGVVGVWWGVGGGWGGGGGGVVWWGWGGGGGWVQHLSIYSIAVFVE